MAFSLSEKCLVGSCLTRDDSPVKLTVTAQRKFDNVDYSLLELPPKFYEAIDLYTDTVSPVKVH